MDEWRAVMGEWCEWYESAAENDSETWEVRLEPGTFTYTDVRVIRLEPPTIITLDPDQPA